MEGRQAGNHHAVDVEQRQAAEQHVVHPVVGVQAHDLGHRHLVEVAVRRQLRRAGGAAGVEIGSDVVRMDRPSALQAVCRAVGDQRIEVQHALRQRPALGLERLALRRRQQVGRIDHDDRVQLRQLRAQAGDLLPQVGAGERRQGHQHPGVGGADQLGDVLRLQQRVDRIDDPGSLAAPDHVVGLRQVGQQEGHRLVAFQAQPVQGVGGLGDAGEQLGIADPQRFFGGAAMQQAAQGDTLAVALGRALQQFVGAGRQVTLFQRHAFQGFDIAQPGDRWGRIHGFLVLPLVSGRTLAGSLRHRPEDATPVVALPLSFCSAPPVARTSPPEGCPGSFAQPPPGPVRPGLEGAGQAWISPRWQHALHWRPFIP
ncbi:Uncharacterised protein [Klebsiella pneumoniae]|nr:Uncharacterised protein [Klebsiella pneumoniae]